MQLCIFSVVGSESKMQSGGDSSCPRITANMFPQFQGRKVRFVGRIEQQSEGRLTLAGEGNSRVAVETRPGSNFVGPFVEILGTVKGAGMMQEDGFDNFGDSFGKRCESIAVITMSGGGLPSSKHEAGNCGGMYLLYMHTCWLSSWRS